jgi:hypothetical protein
MPHCLSNEDQWSDNLSGKQEFHSMKIKDSRADATSANSLAQKEVAKCRTRDVQTNSKNASMS